MILTRYVDFYQVARVSDVLSVGQVVNLMCIGLDVRGNINLSLKATLPRPRSITNLAIGESVGPVQQTPKVWKPVDNVDKKQDNKGDQPTSGGESLSSIVIRSAAECDEEEKSAGLHLKSKGK